MVWLYDQLHCGWTTRHDPKIPPKYPQSDQSKFTSKQFRKFPLLKRRVALFGWFLARKTYVLKTDQNSAHFLRQFLGNSNVELWVMMCNSPRSRSPLTNASLTMYLTQAVLARINLTQLNSHAIYGDCIGAMRNTLSKYLAKTWSEYNSFSRRVKTLYAVTSA